MFHVKHQLAANPSNRTTAAGHPHPAHMQVLFKERLHVKHQPLKRRRVYVSYAAKVCRVWGSTTTHNLESYPNLQRRVSVPIHGGSVVSRETSRNNPSVSAVTVTFRPLHLCFT